jgi:hypothetical protein
MRKLKIHCLALQLALLLTFAAGGRVVASHRLPAMEPSPFCHSVAQEAQRILVSTTFPTEITSICFAHTETLSLIHPLRSAIDIVETTEPEQEDDDEHSALSRGSVTLFNNDCAKSDARAANASFGVLSPVPLYILHHSWKHFVLPLPRA